MTTPAPLLADLVAAGPANAETTANTDTPTGTANPVGPDQRQNAEDLVRTLYREHGQALLAYVTRRLADRQLAEDVVQETLVKAWRNADRLDLDSGTVRSWLFRVATNLVVDKIRARRCRPAEVAESPAAEAATEDHADAVVAGEYFAALLAGLSPEHRKVLTLVYVHGRTAAEAAAVLGIPVGTAKSRIYHALRTLRAELTQPAGPAGR